MKRTLTAALVAAVAFAAALGQALHVFASGADRALVYCPIDVDAGGCSRIVSALSGAAGPFPGGVDRGYDGTGGTVDLRTVDLSVYRVFVVPSLADDAELKPYALLRDAAVAYRLSRAMQGRFIVWSGTPDQGSQNRDQKDQLLRNLAGWAGVVGSSAYEGTGIVVLQDHSVDGATRYGWLKSIGGLSVRPASDALLAYDTVKALTVTGSGILGGAGRGLAYANMASFGIVTPSLGAFAGVDVRGMIKDPAAAAAEDGQVVMITLPRRLARVVTDREMYYVGQPVPVTGSGWSPGETVTLLFHEQDGALADRTITATADASGSIATSEFQVDSLDGITTFYVTAEGTTSGFADQSAMVMANPSADLDQCENGPLAVPVDCNTDGAWVNGSLNETKAHYFEGNSVPYRVIFGNLNTSVSHVVTIEWDVTKGGKHAIDYLTTYNRTELTADPCAGVTGCGSPSPFSIPADTIVRNGFNMIDDPPAGPTGGDDIAQIAGSFTLFNGTITSVGAYTLTGSLTGDASLRISITFTTTVSNPVLAWGGHIATRQDWGLANSAVNIPGSPYHMRVVDLDGSGGNQDRSLSAGAVVFPASLTIVKVAVPQSEQDFNFTTSGPELSGFSLDDDGETIVLPNSRTFSLTSFGAPNTRTVTEADPSPGFALTGLVCTEDPGGLPQTNNSSTSLETRTATIVAEEGEIIVCTFTNTLQTGTLIVQKVLPNDDGGTATADQFSFSVNGGAATAFETDGENALTVSVGTYSVVETNPQTGYTLSYANDQNANANCTDLTVAAGSTVTCTITNDDVAPQLTLVKDPTNDNGGNATPDDFLLTIGGNAATSGTAYPLAANTPYAINETQLTGYTFVSITGDPKCPAALGGTITLDEGDDITCTITNDDIPPTLETAFAYGGDGVATCFTGEIPEGDLDANRWGWTNKVQPNTTASFELYAGAGQCDLSKGTLVGTVTVVHNGSTVTVTYEMNDGFTLDETHVYVGSAPLPTGRRGDTVAPGKYPYGHDLTNASSDMYEIDANGNVYVIAHAVVVIPAS